MSHALADDEILKNTFANNAFENFEIAAYKTLIALCAPAGQESARPLLQISSTSRQRSESLRVVMPCQQALCNGLRDECGDVCLLG